MPKSVGRVRSFFGNVGILFRGYCYIRTLGPTTLTVVANLSGTPAAVEAVAGQVVITTHARTEAPTTLDPWESLAVLTPAADLWEGSRDAS